MSRHLLAAMDPGLVVWVGWDPPLATFFLQVQPPGAGDADELVVWAGTEVGEIATASQLVALAQEWAEVPEGLALVLEEDQRRCR